MSAHMTDRPRKLEGRQLWLFLPWLGLVLWCLSDRIGMAEEAVGGLSFAPARGEEACFGAGETDNCPFQLTITLSAGDLVRQVANPRNFAEMQAGAAELVANAMSGNALDETVKIRIPSIGYRPGSFDEVLIYNSQGRSITPELCRGEFRPRSNSSGLTGSIVIEKFTPSVLEGNYFGALYKPVAKDSQGNIRCNSEPVVVQGSFRFSLPMLMDERFELHVAEDDRILAFGTAAWKGGAIAWADDERQEPAPATAPPGGGAVTAESLGCVCTCEALQSAGTSPVCQGMCQAQGLVCQSEPTEEGEWTVEHTLRELEKLGLPQESLHFIRQSLENASPEERKALVEVYRQR